MNSSNITVLTQSHAVATKKRKAKRDEIQEVIFDDEARRCVIQNYSLLCQCRTEIKFEAFLCMDFVGNF